MRIRALCIFLLVVSVVSQAQGMIRHIFVFEPAVSLEEFDIWYFRVHSQECVRYYGPWLRRYETYPSKPVPAEADRFNVYRGRYTELWYESTEQWREAAPYSRSYTPSPWSGLSSEQRPTATVIVPAMPTEEFLAEPIPDERPFLRWVVLMRYPDGVSIEEGEKWYLEVHAEEAKKLPGLLRYASYRAVEDSPIRSPWVRVTELWFKDYDAWRKAVLETNMDYTPPPWARDGGRWTEAVTTFIPYEPDVDFLYARSRLP